MLKNYIIIGWRNLTKNKLFSLINISGMAISIASFLVITLYVLDEFKFDRHVNDASLKYRVYNEEFTDDGHHRFLSMVPPMMGPTLTEEYPEVESYVRIMNIQSNLLFKVGERKLTENRGGYADPGIFDMFSLSLVEGDPGKALTEANTIAISKSVAKKYFDERPAVGQAIFIGKSEVTVAAVYNDFPAHSHLQMDYMLAMQGLINEIPERIQSWQWRQFHTYIKVENGTVEEQLEVKLKDLAERHAWPLTKPNGSWYIPHLMALQKIHLHAGNQQWDLAVRGNAQTVYILSGTAIFILVIAILNFINLSTARAVSRVKEVGVRKVVGAARKQLISQFISESMIIALISLLFGIVILELFLPSLNSFTEKNIPTAIFFNPQIALTGFLFALLIGAAAGVYPAFYISGYKPALILSNKNTRSGRTTLRKGLVVVQFILAFFLIIASLIVSDQHRYMRNKDMGFDKDNLLVLPLRGEMGANLESTKNSFLDHSNVLSGSLGYGLPGQAFAGDGVVDLRTGKQSPISLLTVDHDYTKTLGLELIAGRDFDKDRPSDELDAFLLSESGAKMFGFENPAEAIGLELGWDRWDDPDQMKRGKVIGIVKDFHLNSLKESLSPVVLHIFPFAYSTLSLRIKPDDLSSTLSHVAETWKKFNSEWPLEYKFLDENFDKLYKTEEKLATLFTFFTGLSIFVACFGLFGLVVFSTTQKYKEISIRKVLGAREVTLVLGLVKNYVILVGVAFLIAIPLSYYVADQWLQNFAYRMEITPLVFVKAGLFILMLSLVTVGIQSLRAARSNPVNALKEE